MSPSAAAATMRERLRAQASFVLNCPRKRRMLASASASAALVLLLWWSWWRRGDPVRHLRTRGRIDGGGALAETAELGGGGGGNLTLPEIGLLYE